MGAKKEDHGLYVLRYALEAMRLHIITPRQAVLLAQVDRQCNPWEPREPAESVASFRMSYLRQILCTTTRTVNSSITDLAQHRNRNWRWLKARKLNRYRWQLSTKPQNRDEQQQGGLYIHPPTRKAFELGELSPTEMLLVAKVTTFTIGGGSCYCSNRWFGEFLGVTEQRAKQLVRQLVGRGWLTSQPISHDDLRSLLGKEYHDRHPAENNGDRLNRRGRTSRLLWPPKELPELWPKGKAPPSINNWEDDGSAGEYVSASPKPVQQTPAAWDDDNEDDDDGGDDRLRNANKHERVSADELSPEDYCER